MDDLVVAAPPALITYYDDATGERTALSAAQLGEWAAASAALLVEGCRLRRGDRAAVLLPPHWETAAVLLGAWSVGLEVSYQGWATAGLQKPGRYDVTFVAGSRVRSWLEDPPRGDHQFVLGEPADGYRDWRGAVRPYLGARPPVLLPGRDERAGPDGTTFGEWSTIAAAIAQAHDIGPSDRVLVDAASSEQPVAWLLVPLMAGASVVLCANLDRATLATRLTEERVTKVL
ncbi:MAG: hypothetical protein QOH97_916 [Actinoplanes sp.]|jgi:uncharacterized protein (TIGR03089 family)|nr:hypothetical protein [Actinoplanes sp.]